MKHPQPAADRDGRRLSRLATAGLVVTVLGLIAAEPAHAYIGPGAGFAALGSLLVLVLALAAAVISLLTWPFRFIVTVIRGWKTYRKASVKRVVVLGLDGMDPGRTARLMEEGRMPNFVRLAREGGFKALGTTTPAMSPVAWSSFATGVHPSRHAIFDFLDRDLHSYIPILSSSEVGPPTKRLKLGPYSIPVGRPRLRLLRRSRTFWSILGDHGIFSTVLRVPITFPPEKFRGVCLSAMCTPDLRGTQGSFTHITDEPDPEGGAHTGGTRVRAERRDGVCHAGLPGPENPLREEGGVLEVPLTVKPLKGGREAEVTLDGKRFRLPLRTYSPWLRVIFRPGLWVKVHGLCRIYITALEPNLRLYVTPIQIDPERPALPISHPRYYAPYLAKLLGRFSTLGLAEDTWALNEGIIDEEAFLEQAWEIHAEREALFFNGLKKTRRGLVAMVFDVTDRLQHMFLRYDCPDHPANRGRDSERYREVVNDLYVRMDDLLGRTREALDDKTLLLVMSDHGFKVFRRGVNLNAWLRDEGYLALRDGAREGGDYFEGVDWSRTRLYAFGLGGLYVNQEGREGQGIVKREEVAGLVQEIQEKLTGLADTDTGEPAVRNVYHTAELYPGPYLDRGPEMLVGFHEGYRADWEGAVGRTAAEVFSDNTKPWGGDHCIDPELVPGILLANRAIDADKPHIIDIAATVLKAFGVEPPAYMEGRPIFEGPPRRSEGEGEGEEREAWKGVVGS